MEQTQLAFTRKQLKTINNYNIIIITKTRSI